MLAQGPTVCPVRIGCKRMAPWDGLQEDCMRLSIKGALELTPGHQLPRATPPPSAAAVLPPWFLGMLHESLKALFFL